MREKLCDRKHRIYGLCFLNFPHLRENRSTYVADIGHAMLRYDCAYGVVQIRRCDGNKGYFPLEPAVILVLHAGALLVMKKCRRYPNAFDVSM